MGRGDSLNNPETGGWGTKTTQSPWNQDEGVVGQWESTAKLRGVNTRLRFFFENNGEVRVQALADGKEIRPREVGHPRRPDEDGHHGRRSEPALYAHQADAARCRTPARD